MKEKHKKQIEADIKRINSALENVNPHIPSVDGLIGAQKHSLLAGGKRIRPLLVLAFSRLFGGSDEAAMPFALAVEMIHTASLIHDDLPSIDNDTLRRGLPTCHVKFGEATALLAADGLFMDAFGVVAKNPYTSPEGTLTAVRVLSDATGTGGLVGGEYVDVMGEGRALPLDEMKQMHASKTGALIKASARLGAIAAGVALDDVRMKSVDLYAENIGLAFQIIDDVLDVTGTTESLGKNPGKDKTAEKSTYLNYYTPKEALDLARSLTDAAISEVIKYEGSEFLADFARDLSERQN
jgi:geranylgeranyl diphosphate synthase type II